MAGRQRATFQKRQKEMKRLEKQKMKAEKRAARRAEKATRPREETPLEVPTLDAPASPPLDVI